MYRAKHYVGKLVDGFYDENLGHLLVGTKENVIAALNVENGDIVWRRVLENGDRGSIQLLQSLNDDHITSNSLRVSGRQEPDRFMVTVTGTNFVLVRVWNTRTGNLGWEWSFQPIIISNDKSHWFATVTTLYHIQTNWNKASIEITAYNLKTGIVETTTREVLLGSSQKQNCDFVQSFLVCTVGAEVIAIDLMLVSKKVLANSITKHTVVQVNFNIIFNYYNSWIVLNSN